VAVQRVDERLACPSGRVGSYRAYEAEMARLADAVLGQPA